MAILCSATGAYSSFASGGAAYNLLVDPLWSSGLMVGFGLLMVGVVLTALVYVFSGLFNDDKMRAWARIELFEIAYSAFILGFAVFAIGMADEVANCISNASFKSPSALVLCNSPNNPLLTSTTSVYNDIPYCHMRMAIWYLDTLFENTNKEAFTIYQDYMLKSLLADFAINIEFVFEKAGFFVFNPWRGFFVIGNDLRNFAFDTMVKLLIAIKFQEIFLVFSSRAFPVLFIFGAVLRTFVFTRKLGGLLMAIALAMFFILPLFYVFGAVLIDQIRHNGVEHCILNNPGMSANDCDKQVSIFSNLYIDGQIPFMQSSLNFGANNPSTKGGTLGGAGGVVSKISQTSPGSAKLTLLGSCRSSADCRVSTFCNDPNFPNGGCECDIGPPAISGTCVYTEQRAKALGDTSSSFLGQLSRRSLKDVMSDFYAEGGYIDGLARVTFFTLFFSFMGVLSTIAGIRTLSILLGGDVEIAGLTHLI